MEIFPNELSFKSPRLLYVGHETVNCLPRAQSPWKLSALDGSSLTLLLNRGYQKVTAVKGTNGGFLWRLLLIVSNAFSCCLFARWQRPMGVISVADTVLHPVLTFACLQLNENPVK